MKDAIAAEGSASDSDPLGSGSNSDKETFWTLGHCYRLELDLDSHVHAPVLNIPMRKILMEKIFCSGIIIEIFEQ